VAAKATRLESEWNKIYLDECYHSPKICKISQSLKTRGSAVFKELYERQPKITNLFPNKHLTFDIRKKVVDWDGCFRHKLIERMWYYNILFDILEIVTKKLKFNWFY